MILFLIVRQTCTAIFKKSLSFLVAARNGWDIPRVCKDNSSQNWGPFQYVQAADGSPGEILETMLARNINLPMH